MFTQNQLNALYAQNQLIGFKVQQYDTSMDIPNLVRTGLVASKYGRALHYILRQYEWKKAAIVWNDNGKDQCFVKVSSRQSPSLAFWPRNMTAWFTPIKPDQSSFF